MRRALLFVALAACGSRTELMFGVATDLRAPDALDQVTLELTRVDNGVPQHQLIWDISGDLTEPFNLPGSFGVFSEGEEFAVEAKLAGFKNNELIVSRRSIVSLIEGETLFYRMGLTAGCVDRLDCPETSTCVEGVCRDINVPARQLPDFTATLVNELTCAAGVTYLDTGTGDPMPLSGDALACPAGQCLEGTCLKPPVQDGTARTVRGSQIETFLRPNNQVASVPLDLSALEVSALVARPDGGFDTFPGIGRSDGTFAIPDVPSGTYTLKIGTEFTVSSADNVDLGFVELGRPDRTDVTDTANTGFNFNVSGLEAWADGDLLTAYAPDANVWSFGLHDFLSTPPTVGQTALVDAALTYDAGGQDGLHLVENDVFAVVQYTTKTATDGTPYRAATKILTPPPFTMVEGQLAQISGAFADVPQTETVSLDIRQLEWENAVGWNGSNPSLINPTAIPVTFTELAPSDGGAGVVMHGQPGGVTYGQFSATLDYLLINAPVGRNAMFANLTYGKPHISSYVFAPLVVAGVAYRVDYRLPGAMNPARQFVTTRFIGPQNADVMTVSPVLGPIRSPVIDDRDIFVAQSNVRPTPRLAWAAPALGSASMYTVVVFRLFINANNNTNKALAAIIRTTDTFLDLPPGILEPGQSYFFVITSTTIGNIDAPRRARLPDASSQIASAIMTIGTQGDGATMPLPDAGTGGGNP